MKHWLTVHCLCLTLLVSAWFVSSAHSADVTVGLLAGSNNLGEVEEAAYEWAADNFQAKTLLVDKLGNFKSNGGTAMQPEAFSVLWMFYTETNTLPDPFLADATKKAVLNYVEAGGGVFLSALALRYVMELDVEKGGDPRVFGPLGKEPPEIGVIPLLTVKTIPSLRDLIPVNRSFSPVWRKMDLRQIFSISDKTQRVQSSARRHAAVVPVVENVPLLNMRWETV